MTSRDSSRVTRDLLQRSPSEAQGEGLIEFLLGIVLVYVVKCVLKLSWPDGSKYFAVFFV